MVVSWWGVCVRGDMCVGEICVCFFLSFLLIFIMYIKWIGWYGIEKVVNIGKGGKFCVIVVLILGWFLIG